MRYQPFNLQQKLGLVDAAWSPKILAATHDYQRRADRVDGGVKTMSMEPRGGVNTGAAGGGPTASGEQWV